MNIKSMRIRSYRSFKVDERMPPPEAVERCWTPKDAKAVMDMRRRCPLMGKARIQCMPRRDGLALSVSTVGRLLSRALATGERRRIPLRVLPPRRPQWNGCVERANRSARIEFWNRYDGPLTVTAIAPALVKYEFFHNRDGQGLGDRID